MKDFREFREFIEEESVKNKLIKFAKSNKISIDAKDLKDVIKYADLKNYEAVVKRGAAAGLDAIELKGGHGYDLVMIAPLVKYNGNFGVVTSKKLEPRGKDDVQFHYNSKGVTFRHVMRALEWADKNL